MVYYQRISPHILPGPVDPLHPSFYSNLWSFAFSECPKTPSTPSTRPTRNTRTDILISTVQIFVFFARRRDCIFTTGGSRGWTLTTQGVGGQTPTIWHVPPFFSTIFLLPFLISRSFFQPPPLRVLGTDSAGHPPPAPSAVSRIRNELARVHRSVKTASWFLCFWQWLLLRVRGRVVRRRELMAKSWEGRLIKKMGEIFLVNLKPVIFARHSIRWACKSENQRSGLRGGGGECFWRGFPKVCLWHFVFDVIYTVSQISSPTTFRMLIAGIRLY